MSEAAVSSDSGMSIGGSSSYVGENDQQMRDNYIKSTDSDYVKLSKQGGTKDLLCINTQAEKGTSAVSYKKSDWYSDHTVEDMAKSRAESASGARNGGQNGHNHNAPLTIGSTSAFVGQDDQKLRDNYIKSTDSEYVKLSKQGGQKDLLRIDANVRNETPVRYKKTTDWYTDNPQEVSPGSKQWKAPDYMTHEATGDHAPKAQTTQADQPRQKTAREERLINQARNNSRETPFMTDNLSYWERK